MEARETVTSGDGYRGLTVPPISINVPTVSDVLQILPSSQPGMRRQVSVRRSIRRSIRGSQSVPAVGNIGLTSTTSARHLPQAAQPASQLASLSAAYSSSIDEVDLSLAYPLDTPSAEAMMEEGGDEEDDTFPTSKRQSVEGILAGPSASTDRYRTSSAASIVSRLLNRGDSSNSIGYTEDSLLCAPVARAAGGTLSSAASLSIHSIQATPHDQRVVQQHQGQIAEDPRSLDERKQSIPLLSSNSTSVVAGKHATNSYDFGRGAILSNITGNHRDTPTQKNVKHDAIIRQGLRHGTMARHRQDTMGSLGNARRPTGVSMFGQGGFRSRISSTAGWRGAGVPGRITSPLGVQADVANSLARIDSMSRAVASSSRRRLAARQATLKPNEDISTEIADILDMTLKGDLQEQMAPIESKHSLHPTFSQHSAFEVHSLDTQPVPTTHAVTNMQKMMWTLDLYKAKVTDLFSNLSYRLAIWNSRLKAIEGKYGTGVVSYFVFLRSLLWMNILLFLPILCFMMIPQATQGVDQWRNVSVSKSWEEHFADTITGGGYLETSPFFFSGYTNGTIGEKYRMPEAFFYTAVAVMLLSFTIVSARTYKSYKRTLTRDKENFYSFTSKIFGGWDYSIDNEESARVQCISIHRHVQEELLFEKAAAMVWTTEQKVEAYTRRLAVNLITVGMLGTASVAIYYASDFSLKAIQEIQNTDNNASPSLYIKKFAVSLTIGVFDISFPVLFGKLAEYENWRTPRAEVKYTLYRTIVLKLSSVIVLMVSIFIRISDCESREVKTTECLCWELVTAQELWQLSIVSFIFAATAIVGFQLFWRIMWQRYSFVDKTIGPPEFQIAKYILELVYMQALVWLGFYFSPGITVIIIFEMFLLFYLQMWSLFFNLRPCHRPYRAGSNNAFQLLTMATFLICLFPLGYAFVTFTPSSSCGPLQGQSSTFGITNKVTSEAPAWIVSFLSVVFSSVFLVPLFIVFVLIVVFSYARSKGQRERALVLKGHLIVEGKDKQFLIAKVTSQQGIIHGLVTRLMATQSQLMIMEEEHLAKSRSNTDVPDVDKMLDEMSVTSEADLFTNADGQETVVMLAKYTDETAADIDSAEYVPDEDDDLHYSD